MRKVLLIGLLCATAITAAGCGGEAEPSAPPAPVPVVVEETPVSSTNTDAIPISIGTTSDPYLFNPNDLELLAGQTYAFEMTSDKELHSFTVSELGLNVNVMPNTTEIINVKFDTPGIYQLICLPHEIYGMVAKITVNE
jgi:cytochrome c oxidase subunit 2